MAVPDANVTRAPAWTVFPFAALMARERINGYKFATPSPVRNRPLNPIKVFSVLQKSRNPIPARIMETVTTARVEKR
jgi:hypothetical protein